MEGGIFLSVKDLMTLMGTDSYAYAAREHQRIRDVLLKKDKRITIKEYCEYEKIEFDYVWDFLRKKKKS